MLSIGIDMLSIGIDMLSIGIDMLSIGIDMLRGKKNLKKHPNLYQVEFINLDVFFKFFLK